MIFYYIRHGDPIYNPDSLTPLGKRQAEAVGRRVAAQGLDRVFASSSIRAIETARPAADRGSSSDATARRPTGLTTS